MSEGQTVKSLNNEQQTLGKFAFPIKLEQRMGGGGVGADFFSNFIMASIESSRSVNPVVK